MKIRKTFEIFYFKQMIEVEHFVLLNSANVVFLLSKISVSHTKSENETNLVFYLELSREALT